MRELAKNGPLTVFVRECWVDATCLRLAGNDPTWTKRPTIHTLAIETIEVEEDQRRQGHCRRFIEQALADPRFDMVIVEGVGNRDLADALLRWGWEFDKGVMDFYKRRDGRAVLSNLALVTSKKE